MRATVALILATTLATIAETAMNKGIQMNSWAWEQNRWLFHWEKKLAELTYFPPSDFSCSDCNSFNSMSSILFWTYIRINTKRVITRFGQADFSFTNSSMRTLRKQSVQLSSCFDSLSILSICPKLGQLSLRKEICRWSSVNQTSSGRYRNK